MDFLIKNCDFPQLCQITRGYSENCAQAIDYPRSRYTQVIIYTMDVVAEHVLPPKKSGFISVCSLGKLQSFMEVEPPCLSATGAAVAAAL